MHSQLQRLIATILLLSMTLQSCTSNLKLDETPNTKLPEQPQKQIASSQSLPGGQQVQVDKPSVLSIVAQNTTYPVASRIPISSRTLVEPLLSTSKLKLEHEEAQPSSCDPSHLEIIKASQTKHARSASQKLLPTPPVPQAAKQRAMLKEIQANPNAAAQLQESLSITQNNFLPRQTFTTHKGEQVQFILGVDNRWQAQVEQRLGHFQRNVTLSVCCAPGYKVEDVLSYEVTQVRQLLHVVKERWGEFVYIGQGGLLGGMMSDEELAVSGFKEDTNRAVQAAASAPTSHSDSSAPTYGTGEEDAFQATETPSGNDEKVGEIIDDVATKVGDLSLEVPQCIRLDFSQYELAQGHREPLMLDYSDSEEEDAPHYGWVYNHTKIEDLRRIQGALVQNRVSSLEEVGPTKLQTDAETIRKAANSPSCTTVLCVALQDKKGRIKKFVFTNLIDYNYRQGQEDAMIEEAHKRGYHVVQAQQSHAEGALFQFLQERPSTYTAIVGMGCDKEPCPSCTILLETFLGDNYHTIIGDRKGRISKHWYTPPALEAVLERRGVNQVTGQQGRLFRNSEGQPAYSPERNIHWGRDYNYARLDRDSWEKRKGQGKHRVREVLEEIKRSDRIMTVHAIQQTTGASCETIISLIGEKYHGDDCIKFISGKEPLEAITALLAHVEFSKLYLAKRNLAELFADKNITYDSGQVEKEVIDKLITKMEREGTWLSGSGSAIYEVLVNYKKYSEELVRERIYEVAGKEVPEKHIIRQAIGEQELLEPGSK